MPWMETYFVYCSVRLGVLIISVISFVSLFVPSVIMFATGLTILKPILDVFNGDEHFKMHSIVRMVAEKVENDSNSLKVLLQIYFFSHMTANILAFYGSLKLKKYLLLPLIFFEFARAVFYFAMHILLMIASKNQVDLGILITHTLLGGFFILFLGYNWTTCVALYQIINLINSERYKALYGDDPFKPLIPKTYNPQETTQCVRVLTTPTYQDISKQKKRNILFNAARKIHSPSAQPIISVLPINDYENYFDSYRNNAKWKQSQWPTTTVKTPSLQKRSDNYEYDVNYNNWHWSEIAPAISVRNKKNFSQQNY